jgi:hypothetical protein
MLAERKAKNYRDAREQFTFWTSRNGQFDFRSYGLLPFGSGFAGLKLQAFTMESTREAPTLRNRGLGTENSGTLHLPASGVEIRISRWTEK